MQARYGRLLRVRARSGDRHDGIRLVLLPLLSVLPLLVDGRRLPPIRPLAAMAGASTCQLRDVTVELSRRFLQATDATVADRQQPSVNSHLYRSFPARDDDTDLLLPTDSADDFGRSPIARHAPDERCIAGAPQPKANVRAQTGAHRVS